MIDSGPPRSFREVWLIVGEIKDDISEIKQSIERIENRTERKETLILASVLCPLIVGILLALIFT